jgi:3-hydroxymyristoyl/3-hydroxydecanoyl-(acyl carrier protein) dehydratase
MGEHFSAFSFVDRITEVKPGSRARGAFSIPHRPGEFPGCLVAEAVGQLAAWAAMAALGFQRRPVAGLAGRVEFMGGARPGETLDLAVELENCDADAVAYRGWACMGGSPILRLTHCVGPMLPTEEFDDPRAVEDHFRLLCGAGAAPGRFPGLTMPKLLLAEATSPGELRAALQIPESAPFFADHFPRRPVFPGSLLLDAKLRLAAHLTGRAALPEKSVPHLTSHLSDVKLRAFLPPGQTVELEARMQSSARGPGSTLVVAARANGKQVAGARVTLAPEETA